MENKTNGVEVQGTKNAMQIAKGIVNYVVNRNGSFYTIEMNAMELSEEVDWKINDTLYELKEKCNGIIPSGTTFVLGFSFDWQTDHYNWFTRDLNVYVEQAHKFKGFYNSLPDEMKVYCDLQAEDKHSKFVQLIQTHNKAYFNNNYGWDFGLFEYYLKQAITEKELPIEYNGLVGVDTMEWKGKEKVVGMKIEFICK